MGLQAAAREQEFLVCDIRGGDRDSIYDMAYDLAEQVMNGLSNLQHSATIQVAMLFITHTGAHLTILAKSDENEPINPAFKSTLASTTYDSESGHLQKYVIPILEAPRAK
jgi:hypothetical protein